VEDTSNAYKLVVKPSAILNYRDGLVPLADNLHRSVVFKMSILIFGSHFYSTWKPNCRQHMDIGHTTFPFLSVPPTFLYPARILLLELLFVNPCSSFRPGDLVFMVIDKFRCET
jgi:hypothetical protein